LGRSALNFAPLAEADLVVQLHVAAASFAVILGIAQFVGKKGATLHRILGWSWVCAMMVLASTSFFIHEIKLWGNFSPIHLLSIFTLFSVPLAVIAARKHDVKRHKHSMTSLFVYALLLAGFFTFAPGRVMHRLFFG